MSRSPRCHHVALFLLAAAGCAQSDTQFNVEYASGFSRRGSAVSIFGIFKDGRMSPDSWAELGPRLAGSLSNSPCEIAYSDELVKTNPGLSSAVDDYVRANGPTDELLDRFAPLALGNGIMILAVAGQTEQATVDAGSETTKSPSSPPSRRGGASRGRRRSQAPTSEHPKVTGHGDLEVSATVFSVALHRSVAVIQMTYSGANADEGFRKFSEKLGAAIPGAACTGWNWNVRVDEDEIRKMGE